MVKIVLFLFSFAGTVSFSQINGYARVSALSGSTLTLTNVNQTNHTFRVGEWAVLMQMQDNVIGSNTADNTSFGNLSAISNAGLYEIRRILTINGNSTAGFTAGAANLNCFNNYRKFILNWCQ